MVKQLTDAESRPTHEEIARLAYTIFEKNGKVPGRDMENWLEAEKQLRNHRPGVHSTANPRTPARPTTRTVLNPRA